MIRLCSLVLPLIILFTCGTQWVWASRINGVSYKDESRLQATIKEFKFRPGSKSTDDLPKENIFITSKTIDNQGAGTIIHIIHAEAKYKDTVEFQIAEPFTKMGSVKADRSVRTECERDVPVVSKSEVQHEIALAYGWSLVSGLVGKNITVNSNNLVQIEHTIKVPPHKECVFNVFLRKVTSYRVDYTAYAKVSNIKGNSSLWTAVKPSQYALKAETIAVEASIYVDFGLSTFVETTCEPPQNSQNRTNSLSPANYPKIYEASIQVLTTPNNYNTGPLTIFSFLKNVFGLLMVYLR